MRVADVGCGAGWSTLAMARAFPQADIVGFDADPASVYDAQRNAAAQGVAVRFDIRAADAVTDDGPFDLVLVLEALHDMARPDEAPARSEKRWRLEAASSSRTRRSPITSTRRRTTSSD